MNKCLERNLSLTTLLQSKGNGNIVSMANTQIHRLGMIK